MLKYASVFAFVTLLIAVAIYNDRVNHNHLAVKTFDLNHDLIVQLEPFPVQVEEQTHLLFNFKKGSNLENMEFQEAWIEGVNMYMGRISVYIESSQQRDKVKGLFFLGSCSEPRMQWRLFIRLKNEGGEEHIMHFDFSTEI